MKRTMLGLLLWSLALSAQAQQPTPIRGWDGSQAFTVGDLSNLALRVVLVGNLGTTTVTATQGNAGTHAQRWMVGLSDGSGFISPATDRSTAAAPFSTRLSDGTAFYDSTKTGQLPAALVGGRLDVNVGNTASFNLAQVGGTAQTGANVVDGVNTAFRVNCVTGCTAGGSFSDNSAFTFGSTAVSIAGGVFDDVAPNALTENSAGAIRLSSRREGYFQLRDAAGNERGANVNASSALLVAQTGELPAGTQNIGDVDVASLPANASVNLNQLASTPLAAPFDADSGAGTQNLQGVSLRKTASGGSVEAGTSTDPLRVDPTGTTTQPVSGTVTVNAGSGTFVVGDGAGALNVIVDSSALPTGASTLSEQQAQTTSLQKIDNLAHSGSDVALSEHVPISGQLDDVATTTVTENQVAPARITSTRALHVAQQGTVTVTATDLDIRNLAAAQDKVDVAQMNGVAVSMGNGATDTGTQRVTLSSDSTGQVAVASLPNEGQQTAANSISTTPDTDNDAIGAEGAAPPGEYVAIGGVTSGATGGFLNGITVCTEMAAVDIVTATTTLVVTGVAGRHVYICSVNLLTAGANNVAIVAGTGATCATSTAGLNGGVTAAEGWNFAANGGIAQGTGLGHIMSTRAPGGATGDSVCIITSAAVQLSGAIGYAIY